MASQVMTGTEVPKVALYSFYRSSSAWRVRLALLFKGIPYEYKAINLQKREQYSDEFKKLSPLQLIPVLEIDGETLVDSIAIIQVLPATLENTTGRVASLVLSM
jgi:glutathione S-transferase